MFFSDDLKEELAQKIKKELDDKELDEEKLKKHIECIQECVEKTDLFNVYDMNSTTGNKDIDEAIIHALLKDKKVSKQHQLNLTLRWKRIDIAKSELFKEDKVWEKKELNSALRYSLLHDQVDFVKLFLEHGVNLKEFLTVKELTFLYNELKERTFIYNYLHKSKKASRNKINLHDVGKLLIEMTMDSYEPLYLKHKRYDLKDSDMGIAVPTDLIQMEVDNESTFDNPIRELLIWSVLQGREEMSRFFWEECKEMIGAALTSCMILKYLSEKEDADQKEHLHRLSYVFEDLAIGVLNECYNEDEERTSIILLRELHQWGRATCLSFAVTGRMKNFISQQGVQNLLTKIWNGKLSKNEPIYITDEDSESSEGYQLSDSLQMVKIQDTKDDESSTGGTNKQHDVGKVLSWYRFFDSPRTTFIINLISYFVFLGLFSYIMLTNFNRKVSVSEYVLVFWMITLFTEELRQIAQGGPNRWWLRFLFWINDYWNIVDIASLILFGVGFIMRLFDKTFSVSRVFLAIDLMIYYIRLLHVFFVIQNLGPKLVMIGKMVVDLAFFTCILFVFLVAYGIASQAIMFPNRNGFIPVIKGIFFHSYFQMYGELFLEDIQVEPGSCTATGGSVGDIDDPCPEFSWVAIVLLAGYMLLSNVLLLNLLIAMFSYTFSTVQDKTDQYWKHRRYKIIAEYISRPPLPPPLIAFSHMYILVTYILSTSDDRTTASLTKDEDNHLSLWESFRGENYLEGKQEKHQQEINERVRSLLGKVDEINLKVEDQNERVNMALDFMKKMECGCGVPKAKSH